jgi:hypothetical protein
LTNEPDRKGEMKMRTHIRAISLAIALAASVGTTMMATGVAEAKPKLADPDARCVFYKSGGYIDFYLPGEVIYNPYTGKRQRCGRDGHWHDVSRVQGTGSGGPGVGGTTATR